MDPRRGPLAVYESKVHGHSQEDNDWMRFGRDVEGAIANMYAAKTKRDVEDLGGTWFQPHSSVSFLSSTLDRVTWEAPTDPDEPGAPLELKHVGNFSKSSDWETDPPLHYQIQLQIQMACLGSPWGSLAALFPGYNLVWKDIERNNEFLDEVYPALEDFWRCVVDKTPPPVESHRDLEVVKRLYPAASGETVALDNETQALVGAWEAAKGWRKHDNETVEAVEAHLRAAIGDATWGALPDGTFLSLKTTKRKGYTRVVGPGEYRTLRRVKSKK
jgi:predicted phage-related endonuclease